MPEDKKNEAEAFVSDVISRVLMICGSLMAVANGLIPSLGAMIYGNLTDEIAIRKNWNCTLNDSTTTIMLRNVSTLEMILPRVTEINVTKIRSIKITLNETEMTVLVLGENGKQLIDRTYENITAVRMKGTALNGTNLTEIDIRGTRVEMVKLKEKSEGKTSGKGPGSQDISGNIERTKREIKRIRKKSEANGGLNLIRRKTEPNSPDDGIDVGNVQSISSVIPPTPKPIILPPTNNVSYTLRNITESCRLFESRVEENMRKYALYYVYAAFATLLFAYGQTVLWNIASERGVRNLSENLTDSVMDIDPGFYDTKIYEGAVNLEDITGPKDVISQKDLEALSGGLGGEIAYMIQSVSNIMSGFLVSFIENWKITMVMMSAAPVLGIVQGVADKAEKFIMKQKDELMKRASGMAKKGLGSIKTVASYAGEKAEKTRYSGNLEAAASLNKIKSLVLAIQKGLTTVLSFGFLGLAFWYSSTLLPGGSVTPGALMTIFMAIIAGVMQMAGTGDQVDDIGDARSAISSLLGIPESADDDPFDQATSQLDAVFGKLDVFNVYFHYPCRPEYQLLKSISFTVDEGQTVALLGDKGCGKSALIKLLQRIYDPQIGKVRLDGQDIRLLDRHWFRQQVGIVHKNPEFFNTSIADNIALGKSESTLEEIVRAAMDAGAHEFIMALPNGYATALNDDGSPLTSYQKHLLALARAMIRKPRILLWEEDLSFMDCPAMNVLTNYLDKARRGRTTVISTSHVSVARIADIIVVLHNGEIIEQGSPTELMLSGGAFRYLATLQYFESQSIHQERLLKTAPVSATLPPVKDGIETLESGVNETEEQTKQQVKGFISKIRQMIQDKLNEGQAAYKMIRMQLQDLPLLLAGALGAAITGMVAPGLSFLFGEIQKFMNDPVRVAKEGPFWASMFVVLGLVVGFGGTLEKFMLSFATEKLRTRLQKMAFDSTINKNAVPQVSGIADAPSLLPETGGKFPDMPQSSEMGLSAGIPSAGGLSPPLAGTPTGIPTSQGFPGMTGLPTGIGGVGAMVPGSVDEGVGGMVPGAVGGGVGGMGPGAVGGGVGGMVPGAVGGDVGGMVPSAVGGGVGGMVPGAVGGGVGGMVPGAVGGGVGGMLPGAVGGGVGGMVPGAVAGGVGGMVPDAVGGGVGGMVPGAVGGGVGGMVPGAVGGGVGGMVPGAVAGGVGGMVPGAVAGGVGGMVPGAMGGGPNENLLLLPDPQKQADELMAKVEKDVEAAMQNSIGKYLGPKVQETITSVSTLGMALYNGWKMTLVVLAGLPIIGIANRMQHNEADVTEEPEGVEALMKTSFKKMETISALGVENKFANKYKDAVFEKYKQALKKIIASGFAFALGQAMVFFIYAGALRFGCYLITIGDMTPIQVIGVLMTVLFGSSATSSSRAPAHASENNEESLNRLFEDEATDVTDQMGDKLDEVEGSLDFKHVELADPLHKEKPLLSQLNVKISAGKKLALVPLDNEKLNPLELLAERFFDPTRGAVFLDGADIRGLDLCWLRSQYAVVSHRCFLPHCSIADNISYGNDYRACAVTRQEIEDAAYSAYAHEFITDLPKGYDTVPDEDQIELNESQKMRIVIARAIIRGPPIIVLDELEEESQAVTDASEILCRNRTCLILTRCRQTVEAADQIVLMYRGRVLEQGTLEELRERRRLYHLLTNFQDADEI